MHFPFARYFWFLMDLETAALRSSLSRKKSNNDPFFLFFILLLFFSFPLEGKEGILQKEGQEEITVDLREPVYRDGVLSTDQGGVISAPQIRIQARQLRYTRKGSGLDFIWTIEGEGDLMVEFGEYLFVGEKLCYDFQAREGVISHGKTAVPPWFFGGETLELRKDGSYLIYNGYVTTSEKDQPDWGIYSNLVEVDKEHRLKARQVYFKAFRYTVLWIPALRIDLDSILDHPIRYRFRWGGRQGPRFGLTYEVFSSEQWKTFLRFDYRLTRGPGGGIETHYHSLDGKTEFQSINYLAKDSSILHRSEKGRYRFQGKFKKGMDQDKTHLLLTYEKISDKDLPSNYRDRDFDFNPSERTQFLLKREEKEWIGSLYARVRINNFQTIKQELPTLEVNFKPFVLGKTGMIVENRANASYLNKEYSKNLLHVRNYSSSRFEYFPTFYRPIAMGRFCTLTPNIGIVSILYGDSPKKEAQWLLLGRGGIDIRTPLYAYYGSFKHVMEPYIRYRYCSSPTSSPHQHDIFDISDGWTGINALSFGIPHALYAKQEDGCSECLLSADVYSNVFFDTDKIPRAVPRLYGKLSFFSLPTLKQSLAMGWNLEHNQVDLFNWRTEWTLNADFAIAAEYRHRGPYWWRKVDHDNFFVDMFHDERRLRHSSLSDQRETLLLHFFYRFHPNWSCELVSRQGWNRRREPSYLEFEFEVLTTIQTAWHVRFSYQHQENEDRVAVFLNVGQLRSPSFFGASKCSGLDGGN